MEVQEIVDANKSIALFMGAKFHPKWHSDIYTNPLPTLEFSNPPTEHASRFWLPVGLQYHKYWDWIMPVVEEIERNGFRVLIGFEKSCMIVKNERALSAKTLCFESSTEVREPNKMYTIQPDTKLLAVWTAVVRYVTWKSNQPPDDEEYSYQRHGGLF